MNYKVSAKKDGKWLNFGRVQTNKYGNLQLSFKNTTDFKKLVNDGGEWLNFSLFEDKPKEGKSTPPAAYDESTFDENEEIPF
jgi:hypothetical protein